MRWPRLVLIAGLLTSYAVVLPAQAAAPHIVVKNGLTQPVFSYQDAIRETVYVQSTEDQDHDGKLDLLSTDIIRPKETKAGLKVPSIYEMSPYYQQLGRGNQDQVKNPEPADFKPTFFPLFFDNYFVPRGYAVVLQDLRGTRNSEGCTVTGGSDEVRDTVATINWLNGTGKAFTADGQPVTASWSTGHVGMIGKSYDGSVANGAASSGVKGLDTIVPISGISSWYDYAGSNGVQYTNAAGTAAEFEFDPSLGRNTPDDTARAGSTQNTVSRFGTCTTVSAQVEAGSADPRAVYDTFWDDRDYRRNIAKVHASVFLIHGLNDTNVKPETYVSWWTALAAHHVPRKIWLHQGSHVDPFDIRRPEYVNELHRWLDYWLQKVPNDVMKEPQADVEQTPGHWITEASWPAPGTQDVTYALTPSGALKPGGKADGSASFTDDPTATEASLADSPGTTQRARLAFRTPVLRQPLHISGTILLTLKGSVDSADTHFTGLLVDYPPAGQQVTTLDYAAGGEGLANGSTKSCWGQSSAGDSACYTDTHEVTVHKPFEVITHGFMDAAHHTSLRQVTPLVPTQSYTFTFNLMGDDYVVAKGHRLGLIVAGSDTDATIPATTLATTTLDLAGSHLVLPVGTAHAAAKPTRATSRPSSSPRTLPTTGGEAELALSGLAGIVIALVLLRRQAKP